MTVRITGDAVKRLIQERKTAERLNNLRLYKIIWCLMLIAEEKQIDSIVELLNISSRTVYNWLSQIMLGRFLWLMGHHYQGRGCKPKLNKEQKDRLYKIIVDGPEEYGFDCGVRRDQKGSSLRLTFARSCSRFEKHQRSNGDLTPYFMPSPSWRQHDRPPYMRSCTKTLSDSWLVTTVRHAGMVWTIVWHAICSN